MLVRKLVISVLVIRLATLGHGKCNHYATSY